MQSENLKILTLNDEHLNLGAKMVPFAGWSMPIQYTTSKEEVLAVRKKAGIFDISHMGEFILKGPETTEFLDYIIPNNFKKLPVGKAIYSPLCNEQGKILDDIIIYKLQEDESLICVNAVNIEKDFDFLNSYLSQFSSCTLQNTSDQTGLIAAQGPEALRHIEKLNLNLELQNFKTFQVKKLTQTPYGDITLARTGYTGESGLEIFCSNEHMKNLWKDLLKLNLTPCGLAARDILRIEAAYPLYGQELSENFTPFECGISWTVKLQKEKFLCKNSLQEHAPHFTLIKFSVENGIPRQGFDILSHDNEKMGEVTSGTYSFTLNKGIGMARIEKKNYQQDSKLYINLRNKLTPLKLHHNSFLAGD